MVWRQAESYDSPLIEAAAEGDLSPMTFNNGFDERQSQPTAGSAAGAFPAEEFFPDVSLFILRHAGAGVHDFDDDLFRVFEGTGLDGIAGAGVFDRVSHNVVQGEICSNTTAFVMS